MTTLFTLVALAVGLTYVATQSTYPYLKFFAGASWWLLGLFLINTPLVTGSSFVNDAVIPIVFIGGFAVMLWINWRNREAKNSDGFGFRMPRMLGGKSEEEETLERGRKTSQQRRNGYAERLDNAVRGRR